MRCGHNSTEVALVSKWDVVMHLHDHENPSLVNIKETSLDESQS